MISIGDCVYKKSRKPFQNGKRVAIIEGDNSYIHTPKGNIDAVTLVGCDGPVSKAILRSDKEELELLMNRDITNPLGENK